MRELDASNINDLFAIDAPLIHRIRSWITDELQRSIDDLEGIDLEQCVTMIDIDERNRPMYKPTSELIITVKFTDQTSHMLSIQRSDL